MVIRLEMDAAGVARVRVSVSPAFETVLAAPAVRGRKLDLEDLPAVIANVSHHLKAHHLKALSGAGLATAERRGREVPYVLTPLGRQPLSSAA